MSDIAQDVLLAKQDGNQLNKLIARYLPFIKKQLVGLHRMRLEYDDMLSLAMLTFSGCVGQYSAEKGNFLAFCSACIRNRLLDENRKQMRYDHKIVPLLDEERLEADEGYSIAAYNIVQEQTTLAREIEAYALEIKVFGIDFSDLPRICPKQTRSRELCYKLAREIVSVPSIYRAFASTRRIAQSELAARFAISQKTIEKHRKFLVALTVLLHGDYPYIQAYVAKSWEAVK